MRWIVSITSIKYKEQYNLMHDAGHFPGQQVKRHTQNIKSLIDAYDAQSLLDYGCGKAKCYYVGLAHLEWGGIMPKLYDPYFDVYSEKPHGFYDGVICTDVLEHIPYEDIDDVLHDIFSYAIKFIFLVISTKQAKKSLPNGENAHLIVEQEDWWMEKVNYIAKEYPDDIDVMVKFEG